MIGRQVIKTNQAFTLEELEQFMKKHWDREQYNDFVVGRPTPASIEKYILLPATERFMVIVYPRKAGGVFHRDNKVVLAVCDTPKGAEMEIFRSIHSHNVFFGAWKIDKTISMEEERKGPAEEALQNYSSYMRKLLNAGGYML
ncbi:MAG: hypothetical protein KBS74_00900 [Clostridiales bacterium]|nr:hypothetical protein [Candidatus Cacconaster stercorequi]